MSGRAPYYLLLNGFQKRHLLAHTDGMVDAKYIQKSGDTTYQEGQRRIVGESDVRSLVDLIAKLAHKMQCVIS